jgi:outer membrane protein OmpA-like peptidoglycan-associated protein
MAAANAFAQGTAPTGLSNPDVYKDKEALKKWETGESRFAPKPSDMWELGVHGGFFGYAGDVAIQPGYGFGVHLRKALGYVFAVRFDLMRGQAFGKNFKSLSSGTPLSQVGANTSLSHLGYSPAKPYYLSYSSEYYQAAVEGVVNVGNLLFHKANNKWGVYGFAGVGLSAYSTKYDAKNGDKLYDFSPASLGTQDLTTFAGRDERYRKLNSLWDGSYETNGMAKTSDIDIFFNRKKDNFTTNVVVPMGFGLSYRLSSRVNVSIEEQVILLDDDLLDGQDRAYDGGFTPNRDIPHYANVRLAFNIGSTKNRVEPLWWYNPMDMPYANLQKITKRPPAEDLLKDDDNDGVINMLDKEADTPAGAAVDTRGRALDSDSDGVKDYVDKEPFTAPGMPVDHDGIGTGLIKNIDCSVCGGGSWFLPSVHFDNDSYCIKGEYYGDLKNVASVLAKNPKVCVAIKGFTDDGRTGDYNSGLAYNRAKAVADFLVSNFGVDKNRIAVKVGGNEAITKTANRRVEIETTACGTTSDSAPASAVNSGTSNCAPAVVPPTAVLISPPIETLKDNGGVRMKITNPKR